MKREDVKREDVKREAVPYTEAPHRKNAAEWVMWVALWPVAKIVRLAQRKKLRMNADKHG